MMDRTWYRDVLSKTLNAVHMSASLETIKQGVDPQHSMYAETMEMISKNLRDELQLVVENKNDLDYHASLEHIVDIMLEVWIAYLEANLPFDKFERTAVILQNKNIPPLGDASNPQ